MNRTIRGRALGLLVGLFLSFSAFAQDVVPIGPPESKTVTVNFSRTEDSRIKLERLDGDSTTLEASGIKYVSTPIMTDDEARRGTCRVLGVPPGKYLLNISRLGLKQTITIPADNSKSIIVTVTFKAGTVEIKLAPGSK